MKSAQRGGRTSKAEVTNVSRLGFWLALDDREVFAPFAAFPWFRDYSVWQILAVKGVDVGDTLQIDILMQDA